MLDFTCLEHMRKANNINNVELSWQISHHNCGDFYQRGSCCLIIILLNNQYTELLGEREKHSLVVMSENKTPDIKTGALEETIYVGRRPTRSGSFCQPERFLWRKKENFNSTVFSSGWPRVSVFQKDRSPSDLAWRSQQQQSLCQSQSPGNIWSQYIWWLRSVSKM